MVFFVTSSFFGLMHGASPFSSAMGPVRVKARVEEAAKQTSTEAALLRDGSYGRVLSLYIPMGLDLILLLLLFDL
jgi:hypothetical protein